MTVVDIASRCENEPGVVGHACDGCLGTSIRRMSTALREAQHWLFNVRLCPSLAGIELLKDGGYFVARIDQRPSRSVAFCPLTLRAEQTTSVGCWLVRNAGARTGLRCSPDIR